MCDWKVLLVMLTVDPTAKASYNTATPAPDPSEMLFVPPENELLVKLLEEIVAWQDVATPVCDRAIAPPYTTACALLVSS